MPNVLPGTKGDDYSFVRYGDRVYVVYTPEVGGIKFLAAWRLSPKEYDAFHIQPNQIRSVTQSQFQNLQVMGDASEIQNTDQHPFDTYLDKLEQMYGDVSWLHNKQFMGTMIQGYMEGWNSTEIQQALTQTHWYQKRTEQQRQWITLSKADQRAAIQGAANQIDATIRDLYGVDYDFKSVMTPEEKKALAEKIASGKWGDPSEGLQLWAAKERLKAEKIEGTAAWITKEQTGEAQQAFMNRPEDMQQKIKDEAYAYLGPRGLPSDDTLRRWAGSLVDETKSDADWRGFLEKRAGQLYPWLSPGETWQDFADPYKRMAEQTLGRPVQWEDPTLRDLGASDDKGVPNGAAMTFHDFDVALRKTDEFWGSTTARDQGYQLLNYLNSTFRGVGS
jgi:hypothetical protein